VDRLYIKMESVDPTVQFVHVILVIRR
jgi:hypothetical protein